MKIFVTSDIHGSAILLSKLSLVPRIYQGVDLVAVCGDIGGRGGSTIESLGTSQLEDHEGFLKSLEGLYHTYGLDSFYILGNDDWYEAGSDSGYLSKPMEYVVGDEKQLLIPFELVNITPFTTNREANENKIWYELSKIRASVGDEALKKAVIIAHDPPRGCCDFVMRPRIGEDGHVGSRSIRRFIEEVQPKAWFCGHIHEAYGVDMIGDTYIFNCANSGPYDLRGFIYDTETNDFEKVMVRNYDS